MMSTPPEKLFDKRRKLGADRRFRNRGDDDARRRRGDADADHVARARDQTLAKIAEPGLELGGKLAPCPRNIAFSYRCVTMIASISEVA